MQLKHATSLAWAAVPMLAAIPTPAMAYMGPGLGFGAATTALAFLVAILLGLFSVLWYPVKRLVRRLRRDTDKAE